MERIGELKEKSLGFLGFPNYKVTSSGEVWSQKRMGSKKGLGDWRKLSSAPVKSGHLCVSLKNENGRRESRQVHRLVLEAFVGVHQEGQECRHLDGNPKNNNLSNLCWGSRAENQQDRAAHGTSNRGDRHGNSKLTYKAVVAMREKHQEGTSISELGRQFGVDRSTASLAVNKKLWKHI